jgi:hypothetical protein
MTLVAVGCLILDGVLLALAGFWARRAELVLGGATSLVLALAVVYLWRRHKRTLAELRRARREVADEARALRDLVRRTPPV